MMKPTNIFKSTNSFIKFLLILVLMSGFTTTFLSCNKAENYPIEPDPLGSGKVRWAESVTPDGWMMVSNG